MNKGFAEDLTEGKFSFPVVHSIRANPTDRQLLSAFSLDILVLCAGSRSFPSWKMKIIIDVLQKRSEAIDLKKHVIEYMRTKTKSFEYTIEVLDKVEGEIREEIRRLGGNDMLDGVMDCLSIKTLKNKDWDVASYDTQCQTSDVTTSATTSVAKI